MANATPTIRTLIADAVSEALRRAVEEGALPAEAAAQPTIEKPRDAKFGDFATNVAMTLAKPAKKAPAAIAQAIVERLPKDGLFSRVEIANPGFINVTLQDAWLQGNLQQVLAAGETYGHTDVAQGEAVLIEYVSANPTGPLHVGHGRWAAIGSTLANLMNAAGYKASQEFYINDAGNQMLNLGRSVLYRMEGRPFPEGEAAKEFYGGSTILDVAEAAKQQIAGELEGLDEEGKIKRLTLFARDYFLAAQKATLARIKVGFDVWYSETTLHQKGEVQKALELLKERGHMFEEGGALWLRSTAFGDDKDRVVIRENGMPTYLAADIAYHLDKLQRTPKLLNIWGADHHGYVARMKAAVQALGYPEDAIEIVIGQLVSLYRGGEPVRMSKRTGEMVTLDEVIDEVGPDAARYFLVMRSADTPLDFDLELAKQQTADNPVFYVQYAHARICSILRNAEEAGFKVDSLKDANLSLLTHADERNLMLRLASFPDEIVKAATAREPHRIARYAQDLAADFHQFYTNCRVLNPAEPELTRARLALAVASRITLANALEGILGVQAPERM
ncbi:arginine--tRNA ligase [bacterium]|nr:arginine--tRNA ligase [bacterium]